jgi:hypothetical protein
MPQHSNLECNTFQDNGIIPYLPGYKKIIVRFIFAVKDDLRHKARLVAGGYLTENPNDGSECSGVVMVRSLRICLVAADSTDLIPRLVMFPQLILRPVPMRKYISLQEQNSDPYKASICHLQSVVWITHLRRSMARSICRHSP